MMQFESRVNVVSIGGKVTDAVTDLPLAFARIEVVTGPEAFEIARAAKKQQMTEALWKQQEKRIDLTISRADGSYFFLNLPAGTYRLKCSMKRPTNYQAITLDTVEVVAPAEGMPPATNFALLHQ
jgi:hypothetical protein